MASSSLVTITGFISDRIMSVVYHLETILLHVVTNCMYSMYVLWVCIYIIYIIYIYMRDLVTFDTGLVQVNLLLSQMRHIPSQ